jgi:hypothetical protein
VKLKSAFVAGMLGGLLAVSASAQQKPQDIAALAADLAYGFCPQFMNGEAVMLNNADLISRGFAAQPSVRNQPGVGEFQLLGQTLADDDVTLGGVPSSLCQVNVIGPSSAEAEKQFRAGLNDLGFTFEPDTENTKPHPSGGKVETLKSKVSDKVVIRVQFMNGTLGSNKVPIAGFQLFSSEK